MTTLDDITREDFERFEDVRNSGMTNMYAIKEVAQLSGLTEEKVAFIIEGNHYAELEQRYPEVRIEDEFEDEIEAW